MSTGEGERGICDVKNFLCCQKGKNYGIFGLLFKKLLMVYPKEAKSCINTIIYIHLATLFEANVEKKLREQLKLFVK